MNRRLRPVTRRYRELAIRAALGASAPVPLALMLRRTMRPVVVGAVIGSAAAIGLAQVLSSVLFGVSTADPIGFGGAALVVVAAVAAAALAALPAARAEPTATLRYE
jgi:putative ABC transport system permease protein